MHFQGCPWPEEALSGWKRGQRVSPTRIGTWRIISKMYSAKVPEHSVNRWNLQGSVTTALGWTHRKNQVSENQHIAVTCRLLSSIEEVRQLQPPCFTLGLVHLAHCPHSLSQTITTEKWCTVDNLIAQSTTFWGHQPMSPRKMVPMPLEQQSHNHFFSQWWWS